MASVLKSHLSLVIVIQLLAVSVGFFVMKSIFPIFPLSFGTFISFYILGAFGYPIVRCAILRLPIQSVYRATNNVGMSNICGSPLMLTIARIFALSAFGIMLFVFWSACILFNLSFIQYTTGFITLTVLSCLAERSIVSKFKKHLVNQKG